MIIKYVHTNIVASNWRKLSDFYIKVLHCIPVLPERNLSGEWLEKLTKIKKAKIRGIHLRLPGYSDYGPTLEIFQYDKNHEVHPAFINQTGLAHLAFHVNEVEPVLEAIIEHGGSQLGELVNHRIEGIGQLTVVYARDPEGNIIELQKWI